jgi:hypothetical protein
MTEDFMDVALNYQPGIRIEPDAKQWWVSNGIGKIPLCRVCAQPMPDGHVDCTCDKNHPENCDRPTYAELLKVGESDSHDPFTPAERIANSRRISGDNADIAVKAMSQLAEAQEMLEVLLEAMVNGTDAIIANAAIKAEGLIETQKGVKLYE